MPPEWVTTLPAVNAGLNGLATLLLLVGFVLIKQKKIEAHKRVMLAAFAVSVVFLGTYLTYHFALEHYTDSAGRKYAGDGWDRTVYFAILISHIILAAAVPFLAVTTIYRGLKGQIEKHRRIARITWPIWMYVSVTGVVIYVMLYHGPGA